MTVGVLLFAADCFVDWFVSGKLPSADAVKLSYQGLAWAWAGAFGIHQFDTDTLRWK